jgi:hypothetical protein
MTYTTLFKILKQVDCLLIYLKNILSRLDDDFENNNNYQFL